MTAESKYLEKVVLFNDVFTACLQHSFSNEKEEVMGLLIGEVDEENLISYISACVILHRSDKQPDRVEISPEQLCTASGYAEELANKLKKPMRVLGWYHSHPHITVWPSHVDLKTQMMYQTMDPLFIGLIFSVYQKEAASYGNNLGLTCFQAYRCDNEYKQRGVKIVLQNSPLNKHNLEAIAEWPKILVQEEGQNYENENNDINDELTRLHNDAFKTLALVHIVTKVTRPLCDDLEKRLTVNKARIKALTKLKKSLLDNKI